MAKFNMDKIKGLGGVPEQNENKGMVGAGLLNVASRHRLPCRKQRSLYHMIRLCAIR